MWLFTLLFGAMPSTGFSRSTLGDSSLRREAAGRIAGEHQVTLDSQQTTVLDPMETEVGLNAVIRNRSRYGVAIDWYNTILRSGLGQSPSGCSQVTKSCC